MNNEAKAIQKIEELTNISSSINLNWPYQKGKRTIFARDYFNNSKLVDFLYNEVRTHLDYFKDLGYEVYFRNNSKIFSVALIPNLIAVTPMTTSIHHQKPKGMGFIDKRHQRIMRKLLWRNLPKPG